MFYDVRAGKYLESSINASRTVVLKASKGYVVSMLNARLSGYGRVLITFLCSILTIKIWMAFSKLSTCRLFTHIVTITVALDCFRLVARCLLIWWEIMQEFGNEFFQPNEMLVVGLVVASSLIEVRELFSSDFNLFENSIDQMKKLHSTFQFYGRPLN